MQLSSLTSALLICILKSSQEKNLHEDNCRIRDKRSWKSWRGKWVGQDWTYSQPASLTNLHCNHPKQREKPPKKKFSTPELYFKKKKFNTLEKKRGTMQNDHKISTQNSKGNQKTRLGRGNKT